MREDEQKSVLTISTAVVSVIPLRFVIMAAMKVILGGGDPAFLCFWGRLLKAGRKISGSQ